MPVVGGWWLMGELTLLILNYSLQLHLNIPEKYYGFHDDYKRCFNIISSNFQPAEPEAMTRSLNMYKKGFVDFEAQIEISQKKFSSNFFFEKFYYIFKKKHRNNS